MNLLDEKMMYGILHGIYKKALRKALQTKSSSLHLIEILEDFANENSESEEEEEELDDESDKENDATVFQLQNPKIKRGKGRPAGTKRYKGLNEKNQGEKTKQQRCCKRCGNLGHYQKNCNV